MKKRTFACLTSVLCIATSIIFASCDKQPTAAFTLDRTDYAAGDVIIITNTSAHAYSYNWLLPTETGTSKEVAPKCTLSLSCPDGSYYVQLEALSKKGDKSSVIQKHFKVQTARGTVNACIKYPGSKITVEVDDMPFEYTVPSSCACNGGCFDLSLPVGSHFIYAKNDSGSWSKTFNVTENGYISWVLE